MKKTLLITAFSLVLVLGNVFAQDSDYSGFLDLINIELDYDGYNQDLLEDFLKRDGVDIQTILSPTLLREFGKYAIRTVTYLKRDIYPNNKLITILQYISDYADTLEDSAGYVRELRMILDDSRNSLVIANAIDTYGSLITKNPPANTDVGSYDIYELFLVDCFRAIEKVILGASRHSARYSEVDGLHLLRLATPYIREVMRTNNGVINNSRIKRSIMLLVTFFRSSVAKPYVREIVYDALYIEASIASKKKSLANEINQ